jgi:hypothetical protein
VQSTPSGGLKELEVAHGEADLILYILTFDRPGRWGLTQTQVLTQT